jgi:hypothetical protein
MNDWVISCPLVCVKAKEEKRKADGGLFNPPKLYAVSYNDEEEEFVVERISFASAATLAPDETRKVVNWLMQQRGGVL